MKVLLKKDLAHLGIVGDVVEVSAGYARNYLMPNQLATRPTAGNVRALAKERVAAEERRRLLLESKRAAAARLAEVEVTIPAAANEEGVLYGSVGRREIAAALNALGHEVEADHVQLHEPIRHLDNATVTVRLAEGISADVKVWVVRERAAKDEETETGKPEAGREADTREQSDS